MFPQFVFILQSRIKQAEARKREKERKKEEKNEEKERERERESADPGREEQDERRQMHAPGLGEEAGVRRPSWSEGADREQKPGPAPRRKKKKKEEAEEEGRRGKKKGGQHSTGKQLRRTLYWQNASTDTVLASDRATKKTSDKRISKVRSRKFIPNNDPKKLTWRESFRKLSGEQRQTIKQKHRQNNTKKHQPDTKAKNQKFAPENFFQNAHLPRRRIFQEAFGRATPNNKAKTKAKQHQKTPTGHKG